MARKVALLLVLLLVTAVPVSAAGLSVSFSETATVTGPIITLGDIASIEGDGAGRLHGIKLGAAAAPGGRVILTPELISMRLSSAGVDFTGVSWHIPPTVTVNTAAQIISGLALVEQATETIKQRLAQTGGETTIVPLAVPGDVVVPVGNAAVNIEIPYGLRYNGPTTVNAVVTVDGLRTDVIPLRFEIKLYKSIVVAARIIAARQVITSEDVRLERADVGRLPSGYITDVNKIIGLESRRSLTAGAVVNESMLAKPVIIKRGSAVTIVAKFGGARVTASGRALQDGAEGQLIRVQNVNSKKVITARVLDDASVQVLAYNGK